MSTAPPSAMQRSQQPGGFSFELPSLPPVTNAGRPSFSPLSTPRLAGVSSILNPSYADDSESGRRRKASELDTNRNYAPSLAPLAMNSQPTDALSDRRGAPLDYGAPTQQSSRRVLTPRSPSLYRAASLSQLQPSSATISAQQVPFPGSPHGRTYSMAPGTSGAPPLPTPSTAARSMYGFPSGPTPSSEAARRAGVDVTRESRAGSGSESPTTSYSSYSQTGQTSPSTQYVPMSTGGLSYGSGTANGPVGIPISSSGGQNTYQMMTLETTSGTVQLPVDVQAASRVADEKRRRNAGASARFRQRRKEKEKEASVTIGKLDQQVKELGEDADFYRRERDYLSGVLSQTPGADRHFPRPPSPRRRRTSTTRTGPSGNGGRGRGGGREASQRSPQQARNVRRRTSTISLPPPPPPQSATTPQIAPFPSGYSMQSYRPPLAPHPIPQHQRSSGPMPSPSPLLRDSMPPRPTLPSMNSSQPPQVMQAPPDTGPWNPYDRRNQAPPSSREQRPS
ncbi:hypothetical protein LTS10_008860 [Elasticomyces elasticus]|nr:hypothetical protein LTS10_008860 [Elasticomyces elasticus]